MALGLYGFRVLGLPGLRVLRALGSLGFYGSEVFEIQGFRVGAFQLYTFTDLGL